MAEKAKLEIDIQANNTKALGEVEQGLNKIENRGKNASSTLSQSFLVLGGAFAAVSAAVGKSVAAFAASERSAAMLSQALRNTGNYSAEAMADLNDYASALQATTAFEDDAIIAAQSLIAAQGYHGQVLKDLTRATLDLAAAKGMDLSSAADILAKSVGTENNVLARYGIEIQGAADSTDRAYSAVKAISDLYGGQAAAAGRTYEGQMASIKNTIGDVAEEIGGVFAPVVLELAKILRNTAVAVGNFVNEHKALAAGIVGSVTAFLGLAAGISGILNVLPILTAAFTVMTGPVGLTIAGIVGLIAAIENWGTISNWLKTIWTNALASLSTAWENFKVWIDTRINGLIKLLMDFGTIAWDIFTGRWKEAIDLAKTHIDGFSNAGKQTFDEMFTTITEGITNFADGAVDIYGDLKERVTTIISNITNAWKNGLAKQTSDTQTENNKKLSLFQTLWNQLILGESMTSQQQQAIQAATSATFTAGNTLMRSKTRELFELGKAASIAGVIVNTIKGAVDAVTATAWMGPVGWVLGAAMAATISAAGATAVAQISSQDMPAAEFGGIIPGSANGTVLRAGERGKSEAIVPLEGEGASRLRDSLGGGSTVINVHVQNMFSDDREAVRKLAGYLDEELEDRRRLKNSVFGLGLKTEMAVS